MRVPWIRVHGTLIDKPVTTRLADALKIRPHEAVGILVTFWSGVAANAKNGHIRDHSDSQLESWARWTRKRGAFASWVRAQHMDADGRVPEWDDYAGKLEQIRERDRIRKSAGNPPEIPRVSAPTRANADADGTISPTTPARRRERTDGETALLAAAPEETRFSLGALFDGWVQGMGYADGKRACDPRDLSTGCLEYMAGRTQPSFAPREIMRWVIDAERRRNGPLAPAGGGGSGYLESELARLRA